MVRTILLLVIGLSMPWHIAAAGSDNWRENLFILPPFCKERAKGITHPRAQSLHHYCGALLFEARARTAGNQDERIRLLQRAASGMSSWAGKNCTSYSQCIFYPDVHTRLARAFSELGQIAEAVKQYQLAIQGKRDYTLAYAGLSDLYVKLNQPDEARNVLEVGLKARPGSKMLQRRIQKLETSSQ
jgi:tetratricopeptide (TPR) repeat protein